MNERSVAFEELQARVEELERLLQRRSTELRTLQRLVSPSALLVLARVMAGRPPLAGLAYAPEVWEESTSLRALEVGTVLEDLWLASPRPDSRHRLAAPEVFPMPRVPTTLSVGAPESWDDSVHLDSADVGEALEQVWSHGDPEETR